MSKVKACVFASGTGSNFQAIIESENLNCEIVLLVCDKPGARVIEIAEKYSIPTFVFHPKDYTSKAVYEKILVEKLKSAGVTWVFLAGYMRLIGPELLDTYEGKIVNIHPSLLPDFPGKDAIGQAFQAGVDKTGVTIHFVDAGMDTGPVIAQESVEVLENDTIHTVTARIQKIEHTLYPKVINQLINESEATLCAKEL
ncbi:phosphoribosylglycinamide formyltransferase [Oceanobacillus bengalensis]|uniref:Phosphoribosylglycinamide formyltransferase n=1 Tax=Oceanobacillus bengalensis TaxID=1435466 RepID=A0A494YUJ6_9BACI|nr:phosphoribosylglycinamide formyltransferase [Oceanobacillus bengalensis]RKQ13824.1 phosphoribosylglycinamide formyltransferase [Oceanobacillus bengalensis]